MHLTELELVDLAEGARPESSAPHLASCDRCRQQLLEMRSLIADAAAVPVPEPSPLFWDQLSARVRDVVAAERQAPRRWWRDILLPRRVLVPVSAAALAVLIVLSALMPRLLTPQQGSARLSTGSTATSAGPDDDFDVDDDASLMLVADLSAEMNADSTADDGLAPTGGAEHAVTHLNDDELRELWQLLQQEMTPSGV